MIGHVAVHGSQLNVAQLLVRLPADVAEVLLLLKVICFSQMLVMFLLQLFVLV